MNLSLGEITYEMAAAAIEAARARHPMAVFGIETMRAALEAALATEPAVAVEHEIKLWPDGCGAYYGCCDCGYQTGPWGRVRVCRKMMKWHAENKR